MRPWLSLRTARLAWRAALFLLPVAMMILFRARSLFSQSPHLSPPHSPNPVESLARNGEGDPPFAGAALSDTTTRVSSRLVLPRRFDFESCLTQCISQRQLKANVELDACPDDNWSQWCASRQASHAELCHAICHRQYSQHGCKRLLVIGGVGLVTRHGFGSALRQIEKLFAWAMLDNRTMVYAEAGSFVPWTSALDSNPNCAERSLHCYFETISHCSASSIDSLMNLFMLSHKSALENASRAPIVLVPDIFDVPRLNNRNFFVLRSRIKAATSAWYRSHYAGFLFSPSEEIVQKVLTPMVAKTFRGTASISTISEARYTSVFVRRGDKTLEMPAVNDSAYLAAIDSVCSSRRIFKVYVHSDSGLAVQNLVAQLNTRANLEVFYMPYVLFSSGAHQSEIATRIFGTPKVRELVNVILTDLFIAANADAWIGTLSSNHCKMQDDLRISNGKLGTKYLSLDAFWG